jgi:hypothetical protein
VFLENNCPPFAAKPLPCNIGTVILGPSPWRWPRGCLRAQTVAAAFELRKGAHLAMTTLRQ